MKTTISFSLPYCLYKVDERIFKLTDEFNTTITFQKKKIEPSRRTQHSENIEFLKDRWGIDGYSEVHIETDKDFTETEEAVDQAIIFSLLVINNFINLYRYFDSDAIHLTRLIKDDLGEFQLYPVSKENKVLHVFTIGFGGGITGLDPNCVLVVSNNIDDSLSKKFRVPLWEELILNANYYIYTAEYRMAILESVIALEVVVSNFIRELCKQKGISKEEGNSYIKNVGVTGNIKVNIKLLINNLDLPEDAIFNQCKSGITIRNNIVHDGITEVSEKEAKDSLEAIKKMMDFILNIN